MPKLRTLNVQCNFLTDLNASFLLLVNKMNAKKKKKTEMGKINIQKQKEEETKKENMSRRITKLRSKL